VSILTKRLIAFNCTPESSRILLFWTSEEAPCIFQQLLMLASLIMIRGSSEEQICSSHSICNGVVYLCAKLGTLNPRINKIRSGGKQCKALETGSNQSLRYRILQTCRFSIPTIFCLSMFLWHQGPSWTAVHKSPIIHMQVQGDFDSWHKVKLRLAKWKYSLKNMFH
jgi:hypothetical protein